jgi:hypothetical protein
VTCVFSCGFGGPHFIGDSAVKTQLASRAKGRVDFTNGFGAHSQLWMLLLWELDYGWDG